MTSTDEERICDPPAPILTRYVNLCDKYTLTIEEAAAYFGIGQKKIRSLVQTHENDDFILHVGVKVLIETLSNPQQSWGESCTQVAITKATEKNSVVYYVRV